MNPQPTIDAMRTAAQTLTVGDVRAKLRAVQAAQDALDGVKAALLVELDSSKDFEIDGASTLNAWVRTQLRLNARQASILVRNSVVLRGLPAVAEVALAGRISAAHVQVFAYGLKHIGLEPVREFEDVFVEVALQNEPGVLFEAVKHLRDKLYPEDLDDAWHRGMDKEDFQVEAVPDGCSVAATPLVRRLHYLRLSEHRHGGEAEEGPRLDFCTARCRRHPQWFAAAGAGFG